MRISIKLQFVLLIALSFPLCSIAYQKSISGKEVFEKNCVKCHGLDGTKGKFKAKDLQKSTMVDTAIIALVRNGKKIMPAYKNKLSPQEVTAVATYVKDMRK